MLFKNRKFAGGYVHSLDAKNRVTVPKKWRFDGDDEDSAYLAIPHPLGYVWFCPPGKIEQLEETMEAIPPTDLQGQHFLMSLMEQSDMLYCDNSGRIVLTPQLIKHAGLEKKFNWWACSGPGRCGIRTAMAHFETIPTPWIWVRKGERPWKSWRGFGKRG